MSSSVRFIGGKRRTPFNGVDNSNTRLGGYPTATDRSLDPSEMFEVQPLGAGQEVGRSCILLKYRDKTVMLDCGLHPAHKGRAAMPYLDNVDLKSIDLLLVTHFHLDHSACLPYFLEKTDFNAPCFMTTPTKSIYKLILQDFIKVSQYKRQGSSTASKGGAGPQNSSALDDETALFGEEELEASMAKISTLDYHEECVVKGIRFKAFHAGHVLGAAMFLIQMGDITVLYTGDYSCDDDRHLKGAEIPVGLGVNIDILIIESTFGTQTLPPVRDREREFTRNIHEIVKRGGRCLIPVFALGRAQELLLILDEYWEKHSSELQSIPIYYASALARRCLSVYRTYIHMMNPAIVQGKSTKNPFEFRHVSNLKHKHEFRDTGPCVIFASPGMLQNGLSRDLFEMWCSNRKNGLVIPGYAVDGTMAKIVQTEPNFVNSLKGNVQLPLKMSVHYVMFAAHADHKQTKLFVKTVRPTHVVLVHGERTAMAKVAASLRKHFSQGFNTPSDSGSATPADRSVAIPSARRHQFLVSTPGNCQTVCMEFAKDKRAKVMGSLVSEIIPTEKSVLNALLVRHDETHTTHSVISPDDLTHFTGIVTSAMHESVLIPMNQSFATLAYFLSRVFDIVLLDSCSRASKSGSPDQNTKQSGVSKAEKKPRRGGERIVVNYGSEVEVTVERSSVAGLLKMQWKSTPATDLIADSLMAAILAVDTDPTGAVAQVMQSDKSGPKKGAPKLNARVLDPDLDAQQCFESILHEQFGKDNVVRHSSVKFEIHRMITLEFKYNVEHLFEEYSDSDQNQKVTFNAEIKATKADGSSWSATEITQAEQLKDRLCALMRLVSNALYPIQPLYDAEQGFSSLPALPVVSDAIPFSEVIRRESVKRSSKRS